MFALGILIGVPLGALAAAAWFALDPEKFTKLVNKNEAKVRARIAKYEPLKDKADAVIDFIKRLDD